MGDIRPYLFWTKSPTVAALCFPYHYFIPITSFIREFEYLSGAEWGGKRGDSKEVRDQSFLKMTIYVPKLRVIRDDEHNFRREGLRDALRAEEMNNGVRWRKGKPYIRCVTWLSLFRKCVEKREMILKGGCVSSLEMFNSGKPQVAFGPRIFLRAACC